MFQKSPNELFGQPNSFLEHIVLENIETEGLT